MRISTYDRIAREYYSVVRKDDMFYSHLFPSELIEMRYRLFMCKASHRLAEFSRLDVFVRCEMILHQADPVFVEYALCAELPEDLYSRRCRYFIAETPVEPGLYEIA